MKSYVYSVIFALLAITAHAQKTVPNNLTVPAGSTLVVHLYAKGVQVYRCTQDAKDTTRYVWTFQEPKAELFTDAGYTKKAGKHYLSATKSPTWELAGGSMVSGAKLQQAAAPDGTSIPWLLLHSVAQSGKGQLAPIVFIQRLNTSGGAAPANASREQKGQLLQVPYTAEYLFYK